MGYVNLKWLNSIIIMPQQLFHPVRLPWPAACILRFCFSTEPEYGTRADMMSIKCGMISDPDVYAITTEAPTVYPATTIDYSPVPQDKITTPSAAYPSRVTVIYGQPATVGEREATTHQASIMTAGLTSQPGTTIASKYNITDEDDEGNMQQDVYSLYKTGEKLWLHAYMNVGDYCVNYRELNVGSMFHETQFIC